MQIITEEARKKVVKLHIKDGRTIASLATEYGICHAAVSNWSRLYRPDYLTSVLTSKSGQVMPISR